MSIHAGNKFIQRSLARIIDIRIEYPLVIDLKASIQKTDIPHRHLVACIGIIKKRFPWLIYVVYGEATVYINIACWEISVVHAHLHIEITNIVSVKLRARWDFVVEEFSVKL